MIRHISTLAVSCGLAIGCTAESKRVCESTNVYPLDADRQCLLESVPADGLQACRANTEKGQSFECVVSPDGDLYIAVRNTAASFESSSWRYGEHLSSTEKELCAQVLVAPYPGVQCE